MNKNAPNIYNLSFFAPVYPHPKFAKRPPWRWPPCENPLPCNDCDDFFLNPEEHLKKKGKKCQL